MTDVTGPAASPQGAADQELKARHRQMWAMGDYPAMVRDFLTPLGERLAEAAGVGQGDRVLDVAAGTGNAAIAAARRGARVVASDLTPELFDDGHARAQAAGVEVEWVEADAEALPFDDAAFDAVLSCIGVMFAPRHEAASAELVRACRPGGTIALLNWTPEGVIGQLFSAMKPFMPPPPPGASPPPLWGDPEHVRGLLGDGVSDLAATREGLPFAIGSAPADFRDYFKARYGPTIVAYKNVGGDAERVAALDAAIDDVFAGANLAGDGEPARYELEYLVVTARRGG